MLDPPVGRGPRRQEQDPAPDRLQQHLLQAVLPVAPVVLVGHVVVAALPERIVAVARLLAFVFTLPTVVRKSGVVHRRPTSALIA